MTLLGDSTAFLYTGADPIQTGVAAGTIIEALRAAVLRGRVTHRDGPPIAGVARHASSTTPSSGTPRRAPTAASTSPSTAARRSRLASSARATSPASARSRSAAQDFEAVDDVVLIPYDDRVTGVDFDDDRACRSPAGAPITDGDGTRRATLLFEPGTEATATLAGRQRRNALGDR